MNDQTQALARRAVACKHWRWMEGMLLQDGRRVVSHTRDNQEILYRRHDGSTIVGCYGYLADGNCLPDLDDPATLGCLLALVREAWGDEWLACKGEYLPTGSDWLVYSGKPHGRGFLTRVAGTRYESEADALVAALEAAP